MFVLRQAFWLLTYYLSAALIGLHFFVRLESLAIKSHTEKIILLAGVF